MTDSVSIIIPTYNGRDKLEATLRSLESQTYPKDSFEVIITDDGSTDGTEQLVKQLDSPLALKYFRHTENKGRASAVNTGARNANGDILIVLDNDIISKSDWIEQHLRCLGKNQNVASIGSVEISSQINKTIMTKFLKNQEQRLYILKTQGKDNLSFWHCWTGNFAVKKSDLDSVGLFDEDFKVYGWEDIELGYRLHKAGINLRYNTNAIGYHNHLTGFREYAKKKYREGLSFGYLLQKHPELKKEVHLANISWLVIFAKITMATLALPFGFLVMPLTDRLLFRSYDALFNFTLYYGMRCSQRQDRGNRSSIRRSDVDEDRH